MDHQQQDPLERRLRQRLRVHQLDPRRRAALFATLTGMGQVWMTGTEAAPFEALEGQADWFRIGTSL